MNNKVIVELIVPDLDSTYTVYLPITKRIGNIILLLNKSLNELSNGQFELSNRNGLYNRLSGEKYNANDLLYDTNIRNGSQLVLL